MNIDNYKHRISPIMFHTMVCGIIYSVFHLYQWYFPVSFVYFIREDSWVEYGTFACYLWAGLMLLRLIITDAKLRNPGHILFCMVLLLIAMEEISWGQRIFGISTPHFILKYNFQAETNIHNALNIPVNFVFSLIVLIWAVVVSHILIKIRFVKGLLNKLGVPLTPYALIPYFVTGYCVKNFNIIIKGGELGECIFGIAFLMFILRIWRKSQENTTQVHVDWVKLSSFSMAVVIATISLMVIAIPKNHNGIKASLHLMAKQRYPHYGMYDQSIRIYEHLRLNKNLQRNETLLEYGVLLRRVHDERATKVLLNALEGANTLKQSVPDKSWPNILAGKIYKQMEKHDLAVIEFQEAITKEQKKLRNSEFNWQKFEALQSMGKIYLEIGNFSLALSHLKKALEFGEEERKILRIKGLIHGKFGEKI